MSAVEAVLTVDLDALAANYALLVDQAQGAEVAPVVKADAYGLGLGPVGRRLWAQGARSFFVARVSEGMLLRQALGPDRPADLYVLDGCPEGAAGDLHASRLRPALNSLAQVESWATFARTVGQVQPCALHVDTGLNRLGLRAEEARALAASDRLKGLEVELVMSHFACADRPADPLNALQAERFAPIAALFVPARAALANSAGLFGDRAWALDLVRTGIALYGGGPLARPDPRFRPVATLTAPVLQVRTVRPGETVGYDATFTAPTSMRIALVAAGYADGVLRASSPGGYSWLRGAPRPFLGRISMDLIALDVSDCEAQPGDLVELLGPNRLLDELAAEAGTIAYEVLTRIGSRARRRHLGEAA